MEYSLQESLSVLTCILPVPSAISSLKLIEIVGFLETPVAPFAGPVLITNGVTGLGGTGTTDAVALADSI